MKNYKRALRRHQKQVVFERRIKEISRSWYPYSIKPKEWYKFEEMYPETAHRIKNHSSIFHRADSWGKVYKQMVKKRKTDYPKDKQMDDEREIHIQQTWFENFCCNCDHFPGDGVLPPNEVSDKPMCPFIEKFKNHTLDGDSEWKTFGCTEFWD